MDVAALERALEATDARPVLVDARLVRRVIKRHRRLAGLGLEVPHAKSYAIERSALLGIVSERELGRAPATLPEHVILLPRPDPHDVARTPPSELLVTSWRHAFHARVHVAIERLVAAGALSPARIRERIHRIGQTEFDEIRLVLRQDEHLLPPYDDRETYVEFVALYLELRSFAPELVSEVFPTLGDAAAIDAIVAEDLDVPRLLEACRPEGAPLAPSAGAKPHAPARDAAPEDGAPLAPERGDAGALIERAGVARSKGNAVRSALLRIRAGAVDDAKIDADALAERLDRALHPNGDAHHAGAIDAAAWSAVLLALMRIAATREGWFRRVEARLLYDIQRACLAGERAIGKVDLVDFALSLGRRPLARLLPATRGIRVARQLHRAAGKVARVGLADADRARLRELFVAASEHADESLRASLRPSVSDTLRDVGFRPESVPERVALGKIVEELLDHATAHGFLALGLVRDAVSKNQLKLPDLSGPRELVLGDALLEADRRLARELDGVHRRGEIYLRILQKGSSLLFGTTLGRFLTLYILLPAGGAYVGILGTGLVLTEIGRLLGLLKHHQHLHFLNITSFSVVTAILFVLLHSGPARAALGHALRAIAFVLGLVFVDVPRWILSRPWIQRFFQSHAILAVGRFVVKPAALTAAAVVATPLRHAAAHTALPAAAMIFAGTGVAMNSRTGVVVEEIVIDAIVRTARRIRRYVVPGLFAMITGLFRRITDAVDRAIYAVDEWLRFGEGQSGAVLAMKAVGGLVWFALAYLVRIYVNVLIEPTFNPIKHFPVVTVAAKIVTPMMLAQRDVIVHALAPVLGVLVGNALMALTTLSLPGFFGFLVWELKENYKLYRATRADALKPVPIGHHGETMGRLLKPGLHSGTVPKLWAKLRRAAKKGDPSVHKHKAAMHEIEEAVHRFVDRELASLLAACERWTGGAVRVAHVALGSNRVRVELARGDAEPCVIAFEEQSGWLVAGVAKAGFAGALASDERVLFEDALGGLYKLAGVDLVREQIEAALPEGTAYDIADEGLVVWTAGWATELVYPLEGGARLEGRVRGEPPREPPPVLERAAIVFGEKPIAWTEWVAAWSGEPRRVVSGGSLLPRRA